jgi:hypothetical protein
MLVVRELWKRGVMPTSNAICKNNKYCTNVAEFNTVKASNLYLNETVIYKRMYDEYQKKTEFNATKLYIPVLPQSALELTLLASFYALANSQTPTNYSLWKILTKLCLQPQNCYNLIELSLQYLSSTESQLRKRLPQTPTEPSLPLLRKLLIDDLLTGCIRDKIGLNLLMKGMWNCSTAHI